MKFLNRKLGMVAVSVLLSVATLNAFACGCAYRTYNLDLRSCHYYYMDADGNRVVSGKYVSWDNKNFPLHKDCCGRLYRVDAWGTKMYVSKHCEAHVCAKHCYK